MPPPGHRNESRLDKPRSTPRRFDKSRDCIGKRFPRRFFRRWANRFSRNSTGVQRYPGGILVTARAEDSHREVLGFAAGVDDVTAFHRWLTRRYYPARLWRLWPAALRLACAPRAWKKLGEILFYPHRAQAMRVDLPAAEFLTLGVAEAQRNQRLAPRLYARLVEQFRQRGVLAFRILVGGELRSVQGFHRAMGAREVARFELHSGSETILFVQPVSPTDARVGNQFA